VPAKLVIGFVILQLNLSLSILQTHTLTHIHTHIFNTQPHSDIRTNTHNYRCTSYPIGSIMFQSRTQE